MSTLDGKLSALDVMEEGQLLWSIAADSRPLLSSSISKLEVSVDITNDYQLFVVCTVQ